MRRLSLLRMGTMTMNPTRLAHAMLFAAALFASSLASGVLGQVATTDGPLVLFWSLQLWLVWRAMAQLAHARWWPH